MKMIYTYQGKQYGSINALLSAVPCLRIEHATIVRELGNGAYEIDGERVQVDSGTIVYFGRVEKMYSKNGSLSSCSGVLNMNNAPISISMRM